MFCEDSIIVCVSGVVVRVATVFVVLFSRLKVKRFV